MIYFVDEDHTAYEAWIVELEVRGHAVQTVTNADEAFALLVDSRAEHAELVVIDVMLAVEDPGTSRFTPERTDDYLETGLRLLEDLSDQLPNAFPTRAVLLTNTTNHTTFREAKRVSQQQNVELWRKSEIYSPVDFGDRVRSRLDWIARQ